MEEKTKEERIIDIKPLGKGKRLLAFLADYFLTLILSFILFNLVVFPLAKLAFNTAAKSNEITQLEEDSNNVLIKSKLMYVDKYSKSEFTSNVEYTFKVFLSYYVFDEETVDSKNPQYGHKLENEVIYHYLVDIKSDVKAYIDAFKLENTDNYFQIGETADSILLKNEYKALLASELLENTEEKDSSETMINIRDHLFARLYYIHVYNDILKNDLIVDGVSYKTCMEKIASINSSLNWIATGSAILTVILSSAIFYVLIPCIHRDRKTISLMMMRIYRVNKNTFAPGKRLETVVNGLYQLLFNLSYTVFLPILYFGVAYCFGLPLLVHFFFIGLIFMLASMAVVLVNEYNRSISDILTQSILINDEEIDNLYKVE